MNHQRRSLTINASLINNGTVEATYAKMGKRSPGVLQAGGAVTLKGSLAVTFAPGAALPGGGDTLAILSAGSSIKDSFANVANGARLATADSKGSFQVNYGKESEAPKLVTLTRFVAAGKAELSSVTILANKPVANAKEGSSGSFVLTRTGNLSKALQVDFIISGTASNGKDYQKLPTTETIKAGEASRQIKVTPVAQSDDAGDTKTVKLTLVPESTYTLGGPAAAKVSISY